MGAFTEQVLRMCTGPTGIQHAGPRPLVETVWRRAGTAAHSSVEPRVTVLVRADHSVTPLQGIEIEFDVVSGQV